MLEWGRAPPPASRAKLGSTRQPQRLSIRLATCWLAALFLFTTFSSAEVLKIVVDDAIQPVTAEYIDRALQMAAANHDQAVLIELNTPGGLVDSTKHHRQNHSLPVPVIVYITPAGSRAGSAGIFILEAADIAAMTPGSNAGAAHPVMLIGKPDETMMKKIENDTAALMRSVVSKRGRNVELAESAVRESKSFTEQEALDKKADRLRCLPNEQDLFRQISGKSFKRFDGSTVTLNLTGQKEIDYQMTLKERILSYIMDPNITLIILFMGALCLYVEFNHPGAVVPGTIGVIFIVLAALQPCTYYQSATAALAMILVGFLLFAAEAKFVSHGVLTIGGIFLLTLGGLLLVDGPIPEMRVHFLTALAVSIPLGLITAFLMSAAVRARRNKVVTGRQGLIGEIGVAETTLSPAGKVFVHGELWDAVSTAPITAGEQVIVRQVDGLTLRVDPAAATKTVMA